jgi:hypothetical protein
VESRTARLPPPAARRLLDAAAPIRLDALADQFVSEIERCFPRHLGGLPRQLERRILAMIPVKLPPRPRLSGGPRPPHITRAVELYLQQSREVEQGSLTEINWGRITVACVPGFAKIRSMWKRRFELIKLRNAVYARLLPRRGGHRLVAGGALNRADHRTHGQARP